MGKAGKTLSTPSPVAPDEAADLEKIGQLWDEGLASGPAVDGKEAIERIRRTLNFPLPAS